MRFVCWQIFVCRIHSSLAFLCFLPSSAGAKILFQCFSYYTMLFSSLHHSRASFLPRHCWRRRRTQLKQHQLNEFIGKRVNFTRHSSCCYFGGADKSEFDFDFVSTLWFRVCVRNNQQQLRRLAWGGAASEFEGKILSFSWVNFVGKFAIVVSSSPSWSTESSLKIHPMKFLIQFPDYEVNV